MTANAQERSASPPALGASPDRINGSLGVPGTTRYSDDYHATGNCPIRLDKLVR